MKRVMQRCVWLLLLGSAWSMAAEPLRVVTAGASVTAIVQELGLAEQVVGIDSTSVPLLEERGLPNVGYQRQLSAEGVLSLKPDVLLGTEEMGPPPVLAQLREAGVDVVVVRAGVVVLVVVGATYVRSTGKPWQVHSLLKVLHFLMLKHGSGQVCQHVRSLGIPLT